MGENLEIHNPIVFNSFSEATEPFTSLCHRLFAGLHINLDVSESTFVAIFAT